MNCSVLRLKSGFILDLLAPADVSVGRIDNSRNLSLSMSDSYQLRVSAKAKHVYLRMSIEHGLQVVVPRGYDLGKIPGLIQRKQKWIERTQRRFADYQARTALMPTEKLPAEITLASINEKWLVEYVEANSRTVRLKPNDNRLVITGQVGSELACKRVLRKWLCQRAYQVLAPWLEAVSRETNLPFEKVSVRLQKSRWGSCSRRKTISLNAKLLFLRPELVRYLFIHELSHLVHMNHSDRYWNFVASKEPGYEALDGEMRTAMRIVPRWVG